MPVDTQGYTRVSRALQRTYVSKTGLPGNKLMLLHKRAGLHICHLYGLLLDGCLLDLLRLSRIRCSQQQQRTNVLELALLVNVLLAAVSHIHVCAR